LSEIKLSTEAIRYIALFESMTGATIKDCLVDEGKLVYVVKDGDMGAAIGRHGDNITHLKKAVDRHIELVEYSEDPMTFIKNAFGPVSVKSVNIRDSNGKKLAFVEVPALEKGLAIGKNGRNIDMIKRIVNRHHYIDDVILI
jgi:N utilization substance protein A